MVFTLRHMFLFVLAISIAMVLATQFHPAAAFLITVGLASAIVFHFPYVMRRPFFYGGIAGVIIGLMLSYLVLSIVFIGYPRERVDYGRRAGQMQSPQVQRDAQEKLHPFIVTCGFVIGATAGLIFSRPKLAGTTSGPCQSCGRINAVTTMICPRCEERIESHQDVHDVVAKNA